MAQLLASIRAGLYRNRKPKFKQWIRLEELKEKTIQAAKEGSSEFPSYLFDFLSAAFDLNKKWFGYLYWEQSIRLFLLGCKNNYPDTNLPLIKDVSPEKNKKDGWDYDGRRWNMYSHLLAKNYGWTLEYIAKLSVAEALGKIQEILVDNQLEKEFIWVGTELAYSYDKNTQESKFNPLPRPNWMLEKSEAPKKTKLLKEYLPIGNVIYDTVSKEYQPKEIDS